MNEKIKIPKKLIEVNLPLDDINKACVREKSIRYGNPSTLHLYWARRPLAAARAVLFASMVNDPGYEAGGGYRRGINKKAAAKKREEYFEIIRDLVKWENLNNEEVIARAKAAIQESWRETCELNKDHPLASQLFNPEKFPAFHDPFAGGGAIPLEAQRLGLESYASDLNPVAVLINKAMIDIPVAFSGSSPIGPVPKGETFSSFIPQGPLGLAEDIRRYGKLLEEEAKKKLGNIYPDVTITEEMAKGRPSLTPYVGMTLPVLAWIWCRTVKSPNPYFSDVDVPLVKTFSLSTKQGNESYIFPIIEGKHYTFTVRDGVAPEALKNGTTQNGSRTGFKCILSGTPITFDYIRNKAKQGLLGQRLMAIILKAQGKRLYISPTEDQERIALDQKPNWIPQGKLPKKALSFSTQGYGMVEWYQLFTARQLKVLTTLSDLIPWVITKVKGDVEDAKSKSQLGYLKGEEFDIHTYCEGVRLYLSFIVDKCADYWSALCSWHISGEKLRNTFGKQALPMTWDFAEANPFSEASGSLSNMIEWVSGAVKFLPRSPFRGFACQSDAKSQKISTNKIVSTDPPYYDNIGYADLSDFFYVWLRHNVHESYPEICSTIATPKLDELIASPFRQGNKRKAEEFFLKGMTEAMHRIAQLAHPAFPVTIYYAFKQSENKSGKSHNTGWETFLSAVLDAGFSITGTWPLQTEMGNRQVAIETNSLASSIVLVCRKRPDGAPTADRRLFTRALKERLKLAMEDLLGFGDKAAIAPVDMSQAIIGPGMEVFSQYKAVINADGTKMTVSDALSLINRYLDEDAFDSDTQFCEIWFKTYGWKQAEYGEADNLARAKGTAVDGLVTSGVVSSGKGKVRLIHWKEMPSDWNPIEDNRISVWEATHQMIRAMQQDGMDSAAKLLSNLESFAGSIRLLCTRMYLLCESQGQKEDARCYNDLVSDWSSISKIAEKFKHSEQVQGELDIY